MPDLDTALTRLAALAEEAKAAAAERAKYPSLTWADAGDAQLLQRYKDARAAFIAAADPQVMKAFVRVTRHAAAVREFAVHGYALSVGDVIELADSLDALAALLTGGEANEILP